LYRGTSAIGGQYWSESSAGSENNPFTINVIDTPTAGTYTYSLKVTVIAGGNFIFGENTGPVIYAYELANVAKHRFF
jgi:hypothetical protein